jgi:hypothetical protein
MSAAVSPDDVAGATRAAAGGVLSSISPLLEQYEVQLAAVTKTQKSLTTRLAAVQDGTLIWRVVAAVLPAGAGRNRGLLWGCALGATPVLAGGCAG